MDYNKYLNWDEIKMQYPNQWVSIIEPESVAGQGLKRGIVVANDKEKKGVFEKTKTLFDNGLSFKLHTIVYTGKIPYIAGLARLEFDNVQS